MDHIQIKSDLIEQLIEISKEAGKAILAVYNTNFDYQIKEDLSPLTKADTLSHNIICQRLKVLTPEIPILSEENSDIPFNIRSSWKQYWLVDPLDGTKEFIKRNGEFTVNIALIEKHKPVLGVIYVPVRKEVFWASKKGSFKKRKAKESVKLDVNQHNEIEKIRVIASRSHFDKQIKNSLKHLKKHEIINVGSSLKFCEIASGSADIYPRFGPTSEWDTAAGQAILEFAGGTVINTDQKKIEYNKKNSYLNENFIAVGKRKDLVSKFI